MRVGGSGGGWPGGGSGGRRGRKTAAIGKPTSNKNGNKNSRPFEIEYASAATTSIRPIAATTRTATLVALTRSAFEGRQHLCDLLEGPVDILERRRVRETQVALTGRSERRSAAASDAAHF